MLNQTFNEAVYSIVALSTCLLVGSSLASKNLGLITGFISFCTTGSALYIKDKKILEQQKQDNARYYELQKRLEDKDCSFALLESQLLKTQEAVRAEKNSLKELKQKFDSSQKVANIERGKIQRLDRKIVKL